VTTVSHHRDFCASRGRSTAALRLAQPVACGSTAGTDRRITMSFDLKRLELLLARTRSADDQAVLASIREANKMLDAEEVSWSVVLSSPSQPIPHPQNRGQSLASLLEQIERSAGSLTDWEFEFIESVKKQHHSGRALSPKQMEVLRRIRSELDGERRMI